jgi:tubulin polyglutamylase TTLL1
VQKYIHNPLLIHKRKFDIRTYAMATSVNGNYKAYCYEEGYLRTSCREFNVSNLANKFIHLTNDAIQKHADDYGKFEPGNKMSYAEFQAYLDKHYTSMNVCLERDILPQIKKLTTDCFRATWGKMDPFKRVNTFEVRIQIL